ncbi:MAG: hypothetical protein AAF604_04585 [Acidobacteriota bacterium]
MSNKAAIAPSFGDVRHFGGLIDSRWVDDPWGLGIRLKVRRAGFEGYQAWLRDAFGKESPLAAKLSKAVLQESVKTRGMRKRKGKGQGVDDELVERAIEKLDFSGEALAGQALEELKPGISEHLIEDWEVTSETGEPVDCSAEQRAAFLLNRPGPEGNVAWVPTEMPYGGQPLGDAWAEFILDEAEDQDAFRAGFLADSAASLPPTPAGSSESGEG